MSAKHTKAAGFTFVELLTVLAIMAVLAAVLFAAFARVREKGRSATCQSNLKQLALAVQQYVQDSDGKFPPMAYVFHRDTPQARLLHWNDVVLPYIKNNAVFLCPSSPLREPLGGTHYAYNWMELNDIIWSPNRNPRHNQMVGSHESKPLSASSTVLNIDLWAQYGDGTLAGGTEIETTCGSDIVGSLHSGGANFSFLDGHVKWLSLAQQGETNCADKPNEP